MTNNDLQQFKKLLEENNKQQAQDFQNRLDSAVDPLHERLDAQREQINTVEKNLRQEIKNSEKNIHKEIKPFLNIILDHDEEIEELQKAVGLRPKH